MTVELQRRDHALSAAVAEHDDRARRMPQREICDRPRGSPRMYFALGIDDEIEHRCSRERLAALFRVRDCGAAEPTQLAFERVDAPGARAPERFVHHGHGRRQVRLSRAMSASACSGPHVPAA